jgi:hypothetical protein
MRWAQPGPQRIGVAGIGAAKLRPRVLPYGPRILAALLGLQDRSQPIPRESASPTSARRAR